MELAFESTANGERKKTAAVAEVASQRGCQTTNPGGLLRTFAAMSSNSCRPLGFT